LIVDVERFWLLWNILSISLMVKFDNLFNFISFQNIRIVFVLGQSDFGVFNVKTSWSKIIWHIISILFVIKLSLNEFKGPIILFFGILVVPISIFFKLNSNGILAIFLEIVSPGCRFINQLVSCAIRLF